MPTEHERQKYIETMLAKRRRRLDRHYGSLVGATVIIGPVALGFAVADLVAGRLPSADEVEFFLGVWAIAVVGMHGWMWEYFTWGRGRHSRR